MSQWDIFISYSRQDSELVHRYAEAFRQAGLKVWLDVEPRPAGPVALPIFMTHGLLESSMLCLFFSEHSAVSPWVQQEFSTFTKKIWSFWDDQVKPTIIILQLPETEDSLFQSILPHQWRPFPEKPLEMGGYKLQDTDQCRRELAEKLKHIIATIDLENVPPIETAANRQHLAERYWNWTMPKALRGWDAAPLPWMLEQLDRLKTPERSTEGLDSEGRGDALRFLPEVLKTEAKGLKFSCLFAEAVAAGIGHRYASIDDRTDDELSRITGRQSQSIVLSTGSPVDLLCSVVSIRTMPPN